MPRPRFTRTRRINKPSKCYFCVQRTSPNYKEIENLKKFMTERGKIMPKMHSGICNKHQRLLSESVKRARFLALIPFLVRPL